MSLVFQIGLFYYKPIYGPIGILTVRSLKGLGITTVNMNYPLETMNGYPSHLLQFPPDQWTDRPSLPSLEPHCKPA